jgi:hypothetical protein
MVSRPRKLPFSEHGRNWHLYYFWYVNVSNSEVL